MTKLGFIGAGQWSTPFALAAKNLGAEISGIYAPDASAQKLAERVGAPAVASADEVIAVADCVLIGSPTGTHGDYLEAVTAAGKAALCASPVAADVAELHRIERLAQGAANLYASLPPRHKPEMIRLKSAIEAGDLGTLGMIRLGVCLPPPQGWRADASQSGGALLETGIYLVDALQWLGGTITRMYGAEADSNLQYHVIVARMMDGTIAHLEISRTEADGVLFEYYEVAGSNGLLEYDSRSAPLMRVESREAAGAGGTGSVGAQVMRPGASCAEHELQALLTQLQSGTGDFPTLNVGIDACRKALTLRDAIAAKQVLKLA